MDTTTLSHGSIDISYLSLGFMYLVSILAMFWLYLQRIEMRKKFLISIFRMTAQLLLAGVVLKYIFSVNNMYLVMGYFLFMSFFAAYTSVSNSKHSIKRYLPLVFVSILSAALFTLSILIFGVVHPTPFYNAQYLIPLSGMILGNSMNSNALALERFTSEMDNSRAIIENRLAMGATPYEAVLPYIRKGIQTAVTPTITNMAGVGIVSLPGMMTGQILAGVDPTVAIKYQIAIMLAIFTSLVINISITLIYGHRLHFTQQYQLK